MKNQQQIISHLRSLPRHGAKSNKFADSAKAIETELEALKKKLPSTTKLLSSMKDSLTAINSESSVLSQGLGKIIGIQQEFQEQTISLVKNLTFFENANAALNKSFGVSSVTAKKYAQTLRGFSKDLGVGDDKLFKYATSLKELTGGFILAQHETKKGIRINKDFQKSLLQGQAFMRNQLGVTDEAAQSFELYAAGMGKTGMEAQLALNGMSVALADVTGMDALQLQKDLTADIAGLSEDMQLQYSKIPGSIELAALKSRVLGTNMEQLHKTGQGLLDIESSVGNEIELQLLTGKRLLTNQGKSLTNEYRKATIQGDANRQAELMHQFIKDQGKELETNIFARKKAAALMGTDEKTLARMIQKEKLIKKLGAEKLMKMHAGDIEKVAAELKAQGKSEKDIDALIKNVDTRSTADMTLDQQKITNSILMKTLGKDIDIKEVRDDAKEFDKKVSGEGGFAQNIFKPLQKELGKVTIVGEAMNSLTAPLTEISKGVPLLNTAMDALNKTVSGFTIKMKTGTIETQDIKKVSDSLIMPDRGPILSPSSNDVIATFQQGGVVANTLGGMGGIDYDKLAAAMTKVKIEVATENTLNGARRF